MTMSADDRTQVDRILGEDWRESSRVDFSVVLSAESVSPRSRPWQRALVVRESTRAPRAANFASFVIAKTRDKQEGEHSVRRERPGALLCLEFSS
jgi:hypothetical protein